MAVAAKTPSSASAAAAASPLAIADTLPSVDFGFDDLKAKMTLFTARFDEFVEKGRKRVLEERNEFRAGIAELEETQSSHLKSLSQIQSLLSTHADTESAHRREKAELLNTISQISTRHATVLSQRDRLRQQIAETQRQIDQRLQAQREYAKKIDDMAGMNEPELTFWEEHLGCRIEGGGGVDLLRVGFWLLGGENSKATTGTAPGVTTLQKATMDGAEPELEAYFTLSTAKRDYEVLSCRPRLDKEKLDDVVEQLNRDRDFGAFLKRMRGLFVEVVKA